MFMHRHHIGEDRHLPRVECSPDQVLVISRCQSPRVKLLRTSLVQSGAWGKRAAGGDRLTRVPDEEGVPCAGSQELPVSQDPGVLSPGGFPGEHAAAAR